MTQFTNDFSREVWETTYRYNDEKTVDDTFRRVATAVASVEITDDLKLQWTEKFIDLLSDFKFVPGGRIISNAGTNYGGTTMINCFVGPRDTNDIDSLDGILRVLRDQSQTLKSEGGWGMNFSWMRPRGAFIYGIGVETPGPVKYMELFDKSSDIITAGSGKEKKEGRGKKKIRKGAMMGILDVWHPNIVEFIIAKQKEGVLSKFNLSVNCSSEFMEKVVAIRELKSKQLTCGDLEHENINLQLNELDKWELVFPDTQHPKYKTEWDGNIYSWKSKGYDYKVYEVISVSYLWNLITQSTYNRNEPGVLFLDNANKTHCWNYAGSKSLIQATNPCAEQVLPFGGTCNLGSLNLAKFVNVERKTFDYESVRKYVSYAIRFLDNVNDCSGAPLPEYKDSMIHRRRIGLGVFGWGSALYLLGIRFGSDKAENFKSELMKIFTHTGVKTSINLAKEKGMFRDCDPIKHSQVDFWKQIELPSEMVQEISVFGIRNSALFSIQPTGNTSIFANVVSGGTEPVFLFDYIRTSIVSLIPDHIKKVSPKWYENEFKETEMFKFVKEGDETILRGVDQFGVVYKIDKNRGLTKETLCEDYAVRILRQRGEWNSNSDWAVTTANLSVEDHIRDVKGFAKWIDSSISKTINLPKDYPFNKFQDVYTDAYQTGYIKGVTTYREGTMTSVLSDVSKTEEVKQDESKIHKTIAPKRPNSLNGDVYHFVLKGIKYYVIVGILNGDPYEIFTGMNLDKKEGEIIIPKSVKHGKIKKKASSKYVLVGDNEEEYHLTNGHNDSNADALSRMVSCALRHGSDVRFICQQLEKTEGDLYSFSRLLGRTLKKYIPDGESIGDKCSNCGGKNIIRESGCAVCKDCGNSRCG